MEAAKLKMRVGIIGGGPAALFIYKQLAESGRNDFEIDIFEKKAALGEGMPYSCEGANNEHVTNVSDNEIPALVTSIAEWVKTQPAEILEKFNIDAGNFNEYKVLPRLLFGRYLSAQFDLVLAMTKQAGIITHLHTGVTVDDIIEKPDENEVWVQAGQENIWKFDTIIICTGHHWPIKHEGIIPGYYDSPYPPAKLELKLNHPVAIRGASLTAIDAIRTLARHNGFFEHDKAGKLTYRLEGDNADFKIVMHSRNGLLPAIRFHLRDPHLSKKSLLSSEQIAAHIAANNGFLSLDFLFENDFKAIFRDKDPDFYQRIKHMNMEEFVASMMELRESLDPFVLFKAEYAEAEKSIQRKESVYWKELLAILSFAMNYPAKHLPSEDMLRLQKVLMPLISIVIAFVPQNSSKELLALHHAGVLSLVGVGADNEVVAESAGGITYHYTSDTGETRSVYYQTFIDCTGQPHLSYNEFPFKSLIEQKVISPARLKFKSAETGRVAWAGGDKEVERFNDDYYLKVPGITINDNFQVVDMYGAARERIFMMAVPFISGYNPDYSGLDFCEAAAQRITKCIVNF